jgi:hypothetical protein
MKRINFLAFSFAAAYFMALPVHARKWTDSTGKFSVEADLIAADKARAVLQNAEHRLIAIDLDKLSKADREFVEQELKKPYDKSSLGGDQVWTMRSGLKVPARIVGYGERDMTVVMRRGKIYVNDRLFDNLPDIYQQMVPKIVDQFEPEDLKTIEDFKAWAARQEGRTRFFHLSGVILELDNGDRYSVPFFFFSEGDLKVLQLGWERWKAAEQGSMDRAREDFLLEAQARAYQRDHAANQQISQLQLGLLATLAGVTSMWEVQLYPQPGVTALPMTVVVPARDSRQATLEALTAHAGYVAGPVRKLSY